MVDKNLKRFWTVILLSSIILASAVIVFRQISERQLLKIDKEDRVVETLVINDRIPKNESILADMRLEDDLTYKVYYGSIDNRIIEDMMSYEMVIIEPANITDEALHQLQKEKVKVIGYQSLLEVGLWDGDIINNLAPEDILIKQSEERGPTADPTSTHYKNLWTKVYIERIFSRGFDGVFLDTIDHVTLFEGSQKNEIIEGTVQWILEIKRSFPDMLIIQNRGFDVFFEGTASMIDGFMWENFDVTRGLEDEDYAELIKEVDDHSKLNGVRIMGLNRRNNPENTSFYKTKKWLYSYVPYGTYSKYYFDDNTTIGWIYDGIIDEAWVLSKEQWFVEEGALDDRIVQQIKDNGVKLYLVMDIGSMRKLEVIEKQLEKAVIIPKDSDDSDKVILNNMTDVYNAYFLSKIETAYAVGYEGILLDGTKNWYDISTNDVPSRLEIYGGYTSFLKKIHETYPKMDLLQYEGIMVLNPDSVPYLNGFVWREFTNALLSDSEWQQTQVEQLSAIAKDENWDVYIFAGGNPKVVKDYCEDKGYLYIP